MNITHVFLSKLELALLVFLLRASKNRLNNSGRPAAEVARKAGVCKICLLH